MAELDSGPELQAVFACWYECHYGAVFGYARRRVPEDAARDAVAEVFLVVWHRWDVAEVGGLPWLCTTAGHTVSVRRRSQRRSSALASRVAAQPSELDRELLLLTVWEQLDVTTAAGVAGCSVAAAHVRLHRARRRLRSVLAARGVDPPHPSAAPLEPCSPSAQLLVQETTP